VADFTYLSLGAGVQSSALLVMSAKGLYGCPKADIAVFADTGDEPYWVYDQVKRLMGWGAHHGIAVHTTQRGHLSHDFTVGQRNGKRFASVPLFTEKGGALRRQCTREYKIEPIHKFVRKHLGYKPRQRVKHNVTAMMGISIDEVIRMKPSPTGWITNIYPLVNASLTRRNCQEILKDEGLPVAQRSACVFCPYHSDAYWHWLKNEHHAEFDRAVEFDRESRDMRVRGVRELAYVHRSLKPLDQVDFDPMRDQIDMFGNECEGMCGV
jgi:hypothetical protein